MIVQCRMTEAFKSKEIILQAQKKFLGKFTNKNVVKLFIDERDANILDSLYRLAKIHVSLFKNSMYILKKMFNITYKNYSFLLQAAVITNKCKTFAMYVCVYKIPILNTNIFNGTFS